jgi:hypothetical protein
MTAAGNTTQGIYDLEKGVRLILTPLTLVAQRAINASIDIDFPYPDPAPYEKPLENAFEEGDVIPANQNAEYVEAVRAVDAIRNEEFWNRLLDMCADAPNRDQLLKSYARQIAGMKQAISKQALGNQLRSDWTILLLSFLATEKEVSEIIRAIQGNLPITNAELIDGFRMFRRLDL